MNFLSYFVNQIPNETSVEFYVESKSLGRSLHRMGGWGTLKALDQIILSFSLLPIHYILNFFYLQDLLWKYFASIQNVLRFIIARFPKVMNSRNMDTNVLYRAKQILVSITIVFHTIASLFTRITLIW